MLPTKKIEDQFPESELGHHRDQLEAYYSARLNSQFRGRHPAHQPREPHREIRRENELRRDEALVPEFGEADDEALLQQYFRYKQEGALGMRAWEDDWTDAELRSAKVVAAEKERHRQLQLRAEMEQARLDEGYRAQEQLEARSLRPLDHKRDEYLIRYGITRDIPTGKYARREANQIDLDMRIRNERNGRRPPKTPIYKTARGA